MSTKIKRYLVWTPGVGDHEARLKRGSRPSIRGSWKAGLRAKHPRRLPVLPAPAPVYCLGLGDLGLGCGHHRRNHWDAGCKRRSKCGCAVMSEVAVT